MSGASALKKINARVKKLAKRFPGKKRTTLQKQAGAEFRAGKLKARRPKAKKVKKVKKVRRRRVAAVSGVKKARRVRRRVRKAARPKVIIRTRTKTVRIGRARPKSMLPVLAVVGVGLGLLYLFTKRSSTPVLIPTSNPVRNNTAAQAVQWAQAAGASAAAIATLIKALNSGSDAQVQQLSAGITSQSGLNDSTVQALLNNSMAGCRY